MLCQREKRPDGYNSWTDDPVDGHSCMRQNISKLQIGWTRLRFSRGKAPKIVKISRRIGVSGVLSQPAEEPEVSAGVYPRDCANPRRGQIRCGSGPQSAVATYPVSDLGTAHPGPVGAVEFPEIAQQA